MSEDKKPGYIVLILCAVIGAVATIFAAYVPFINKSENSTPTNSGNQNADTGTASLNSSSPTPAATIDTSPLLLDEYLSVVCRSDVTSFQRSEVERKFKGNRVLIRGIVQNVHRNQHPHYNSSIVTGAPILVINYNYGGEDDLDKLIYFCRFGTISIAFSEQEVGDLSRLRVGQVVDVIGTFKEFYGTSFLFLKGTLVQTGK